MQLVARRVVSAKVTGSSPVRSVRTRSSEEERLSYTQRVGGSSPSGSTTSSPVAQRLEYRLDTARVVGSNPTGTTKGQ